MKPLQFALPLNKRISSAEIDVNDSLRKDIYNDPILQAKRKKQKKVSFRETTVIYGTLDLKDYSSKEKEMTWYSIKELASIKEGNRPTLKLMRAGEIDLDTDEHCSRGLEHRVYDRAMQRKGLRLKAQAAVFEAQAIQAHNGKKRSPEEMALYYGLVSKPCSVQAQRVAALDELKAFGPNMIERIKVEQFCSSNRAQALGPVQGTTGIQMKPETRWGVSIFFHDYICGI